MGQKANPIALRLGINKTWKSRWYADKDYTECLHEDIAIRRFIHKNLKQAGIAEVVIERTAKKPRITILAARPGIIIGKRGADIDSLKKKLGEIASQEITLNINEVRKPEMDAVLVAEAIATQLERRVSFRRAMKKGMQAALRVGAKGIRVNCSGRLGGAEIARMEWYREGSVPLHTLRADIDYGVATAFTTYGAIGIKVWIYKGESVKAGAEVDAGQSKK